MFNLAAFPTYIKSSSDEDDVDIPLKDQSDFNVSDEIVTANIGDYVIVLVSARSCALKYIARLDNFDEEENEGVFLQRVNRKIDPGINAVTPPFIINENDAASFASEDIILKLTALVVAVVLPEKAASFDFS